MGMQTGVVCSGLSLLLVGFLHCVYSHGLEWTEAWGRRLGRDGLGSQRWGWGGPAVYCQMRELQASWGRHFL